MSGLPFQRRVDNWKAEENVNDIQERLNSEPAFKKAWYAAGNWGFGQFGGDPI